MGCAAVKSFLPPEFGGDQKPKTKVQVNNNGVNMRNGTQNVRMSKNGNVAASGRTQGGTRVGMNNRGVSGSVKTAGGTRISGNSASGGTVRTGSGSSVRVPGTNQVRQTRSTQTSKTSPKPQQKAQRETKGPPEDLKPPKSIPKDKEYERQALEKDERSNRNSNYVTWVHGASWDPDLVNQPSTQVCVGSKAHLPWAFVRVPKIPKTVEEFIGIRDAFGADAGPETAAALFVVAMVVFTQDENVGKQCLVVACDASCLKDAKEGEDGTYKGKKIWGMQAEQLMKRLKEFPRIARSMFFASLPKDNYDLSKLSPLYVKVSDLFAAETKNDFLNRTVWQTARGGGVAMSLHRNTRGIWKTSKFTAMTTLPPAAPVTDDGDDI